MHISFGNGATSWLHTSGMTLVALVRFDSEIKFRHLTRERKCISQKQEREKHEIFPVAQILSLY